MFGFFKKKKKQAQITPAAQECEWNRFVDWCCDTDRWNDKNNYDIANTDHTDYEKAAYYMFWIQSEVNNGGYDQFFSNKDDWQHEKLSEFIKAYLSEDLYKNHMRAFSDFKKDEFETAEMTGENGLYIADDFFYNNEKRFMDILEEMAEKIVKDRSL